jgi:hypothetical protein
VPHSAYLPAVESDLRRLYTNPFAGWRQTARSQHLAEVFAILDGSERSCELYADAMRDEHPAQLAATGWEALALAP